MACKLYLSCLLFLVIAEWALAAKVQFYNEKDYKGLYFEHKTGENHCEELPDNITLSSVKTNGACIMLYTGNKCENPYKEIYTLRIGPEGNHDLSNWGFGDIAGSFHFCYEGKGGDKVDVQLYKLIQREEELVNYPDVCGCINLPSFAVDEVASVDNHGNCIKLYEVENCVGQSVSLPGGVSPASQDLNNVEFFKTAKAIGLCEGFISSSCLKLDVNIFKFQVSFPEMATLEESEATTQQVNLSPKTTFVNKATDTSLTQEYSAKNRIHESIRVERSEGFISSQINVFVEDDLMVETEVKTVPLFGKQTIRPVLQAAYENLSTNSSGSYVHEEDSEIVVSQKIQIEPCTEYTVTAHVTVIHDHPMNYNVYAKVRGFNGGVKMTAEEIKDKLTIMKMTFVEDFDEYTVITKTGGTMKATFGQETLVTGEETQVEDCTPRKGEKGESMIKTSNDDHQNEEIQQYYSRATVMIILMMSMVAAVGVVITITQMFAVIRLLHQSPQYRKRDSFQVQNPPRY